MPLHTWTSSFLERKKASYKNAYAAVTIRLEEMLKHPPVMRGDAVRPLSRGLRHAFLLLAATPCPPPGSSLASDAFPFHHPRPAGWNEPECLRCERRSRVLGCPCLRLVGREEERSCGSLLLRTHATSGGSG